MEMIWSMSLLGNLKTGCHFTQGYYILLSLVDFGQAPFLHVPLFNINAIFVLVNWQNLKLP